MGKLTNASWSKLLNAVQPDKMAATLAVWDSNSQLPWISEIALYDKSKGDFTTDHVEVVLIQKLHDQFNGSLGNIPNGSRLVFTVYWSPCIGCTTKCIRDLMVLLDAANRGIQVKFRFDRFWVRTNKDLVIIDSYKSMLTSRKIEDLTYLSRIDGNQRRLIDELINISANSVLREFEFHTIKDTALRNALKKWPDNTVAQHHYNTVGQSYGRLPHERAEKKDSIYADVFQGHFYLDVWKQRSVLTIGRGPHHRSAVFLNHDLDGGQNLQPIPRSNRD